ncbi:MAG: winged helix-turn-helix domain-containing protein [Aigarchaeota archaeon]|nr:winged helix-turn-helix domain-containing protein [Aigarchaeota archaeon]MCX8203404.1 winged helix-turn-helix domain-containing protein [Nitrososphaeria archaeon]MDW8042765.1 winged helix-turn-helix domain-containing protein [Nitrososphaerota archaeon]
MARRLKRNPKGYSEPIILKTLLKSPMTVSQLEKATKIKKPTLYLSLNRLIKNGLVTSDRAKRNRKFSLTRRGRVIARNRAKAERMLESIMPRLREVLRLGIGMREIEKAISAGS